MRTFLSLLGALLTLEAAVLLAWSNLGIGPEIIANVASTTFAYNAGALGLLAKQSAYSRVGMVLLVASLLPQMWIALSPNRLIDLKVDRRGALAAAVVAMVVW